MRRVGALMPVEEHDPYFQAGLSAFARRFRSWVGPIARNLRPLHAAVQPIDGIESTFRKEISMWRHALLCCCTAALGAGLAISPSKAKAGQTNFTLYSQSVDGVTDFYGPGYGPPGSTYAQASALYTTPYRTGTPVGTIYLSCSSMLAQLDAMCIATIKSANGTDTINIQGYYNEVAELSNNCGPIVQVLGVSGGTGAYKGAQGELSVTHIPVNPAPPSQGCAHTTHDFMFAVSLKHRPDGENDAR